MKLRVFTSKAAPTMIPAGNAGAYFGNYEFMPVDGEPNMLECDIKDEAAIDFFLDTGNFFATETRASKKKAAAKDADAAE